MITRPDVMDLVPEGLVPRWMRDLPVADVVRYMELRRRGFELVGMAAIDDPEDVLDD